MNHALYAHINNKTKMKKKKKKKKKDQSLKPAQANSWRDPFSKTSNKKQGWWSGSSGRAPA
jgi:hypothetical protein